MIVFLKCQEFTEFSKIKHKKSLGCMNFHAKSFKIPDFVNDLQVVQE